MKLTLTIFKGEEFFIGTIKEIPAVFTQGKTIEETKTNVLDALQVYLEDMQQEKLSEKIVLEEDLTIA